MKYEIIKKKRAINDIKNNHNRAEAKAELLMGFINNGLNTETIKSFANMIDLNIDEYELTLAFTYYLMEWNWITESPLNEETIKEIIQYYKKLNITQKVFEDDIEAALEGFELWYYDNK